MDVHVTVFCSFTVTWQHKKCVWPQFKQSNVAYFCFIKTIGTLLFASLEYVVHLIMGWVTAICLLYGHHKDIPES